MTPSTLDINPFLPSNIDDPYPLYDALRREHPVYRIPDTDFYLVSTWELVTEAVSRTDDFSNNLTGVLVRTPDGSAVTFDMNGGGQAVHVLATADEPDHQHQRKLVLPTLVAKRIRALEPVMTEYTQQLWDNGFDGRRIEWVTSVADTLPLQMVATLIGLPAHDVPQLLAWSYDSTELLSGIVTAERLTGVVTSAAELTGYLYSKFREARAHPVDDLLGDLVRCCDAGELSEDVAVLMLVQLVGAGGESTAGLIANSARLLAERPEIQTQLREDPLLVGAFLEETLRLESPFRGHHRHVNADTTLGGMTLAAGSHLILLWGSANRDPESFAEPQVMNLDRGNPRAHFAFGKGAHFCVGAALARLEAKIAIAVLLENSAHFTIDSESPPRWVPSMFVRRHQSLRLAVTG
ncbi:cytochrome P450 [Rhodococcus erythropolis]|uniref:cytochrome P450 n=1 Tax=Rhodococcus TaxID=1827 RepID=UPI001247EA2A|nr:MULTISPECIES: cytochrome P450 [Rhodococcus]MCJ0944543.1 cytochrome P450 [Rhodococcus sp. ARC_M8]QEX13081.1 cytochrome P450 [Rhodococcus erythropolis]UKO85518.1 cytochrome P450 [Rhodococcus erythropolis]ULD42612.1 cytochrome P450 [Rhodococcus qingshengii]